MRIWLKVRNFQILIHQTKPKGVRSHSNECSWPVNSNSIACVRKFILFQYYLIWIKKEKHGSEKVNVHRHIFHMIIQHDEPHKLPLNLPGLKKTTALRQPYSVSSTVRFRKGCTSSSRMRAAIRRTSASPAVLGMTRSFPKRSTSLRFKDLRATPSTRCSLAWARSNATWSSNSRSQKQGMCFAHSTRISSCWRMESQMSW